MESEDFEALESRPPTKEDFLALCRNLNETGVRYVVIGGMAIIQHGYLRATEDIDLLVDGDAENENRLIEALCYLPDKAAKELNAGDIQKYTVVRVADEIVIDLINSACGVDYKQAESLIDRVVVDGIEIPFASLELLWKTKQTVREKDKLDLIFINEQLKKKRSL